MTLRSIITIAAAAALATSLAACGGGGSTGSSAPPVTTTNPQSQGSIPMTFAFRRHPSSSAARRPSYLSEDTEALALYDGATLVYVANVETDGGPLTTVYAADGSTTVTPGTCALTSDEAVCGVTVTTTAGAHKLDVVAYPVNQSSSPTPTATRRSVRATASSFPFEGVILSEGELSVTLVAGANPAKTLSLNGVADQVAFDGVNEIAYNTSTTYGVQIEDSAARQIVQPGNYDNGPVTVTASPSGVVMITGGTISTPPSTPGDQNFDVKCVNTAGGTVTISVNAGTQPNTTYADGLSYSAANYATTPIGSFGFTCDAEPATIPITVDATRRGRK
jgi:hypothetical protein